MLLKQKFKCLVLSRYPRPDPPVMLFSAIALGFTALVLSSLLRAYVDVVKTKTHAVVSSDSDEENHNDRDAPCAQYSRTTETR